jgi:hypothetical protein
VPVPVIEPLLPSVPHPSESIRIFLLYKVWNRGKIANEPTASCWGLWQQNQSDTGPVGGRGARKRQRVGGGGGELAVDKHAGKATDLSLCFKMVRVAVLRSAVLSGARRRQLASCWRQHKRHQNTAAELTSTKPDRILASPFLAHTQISELNFTDFLWQDIGQWLSKPAVVCTVLLACPRSLHLPSKRCFAINNKMV